MNSKKAKRLRALVRHLQERGAVENINWEEYTSRKQRIMLPPASGLEPTRDSTTNYTLHITRALNPSCGKAVYKQMKKRSENLGHRPK